MSVPNVLYKYTCKEAVEDLCTNRRLRWGAPRALNDPFDMQRRPFIEFGPEDFADALSGEWTSIIYGDEPMPKREGNPFFPLMRKWTKAIGHKREDFRAWARESIASQWESFERVLAQERAYWEDYAAKVRVLNLTELRNNIMMWAHYGQGHRGAMLGLRGVSEHDSAWLVAKPVQYVRDVPPLYSAADFARLTVGKVSDLGAQAVLDQLYTKGEAWRYEKEWRVYKLLPEDDGKDYSNDQVYESEVVEVILGARMPDVEVWGLLKLIRRNFPNCAVYRGRASETKFAVELEQLDPEAADRER